MAYVFDRYFAKTHRYAPLESEKKRVLIIISMTLKVTLWEYPICGIYRPNFSERDGNLFEESWIWWLGIIEKRNVAVCRGHELANAL